MSKSDPKIITILKSVGAIITDSHFIGTSGRHMSTYIRKDLLYPHVDLTAKVAKMMAKKTAVYEPEVVVGPALCGIVLSTWIAHFISRQNKKEVLSLFTEKDYEANVTYDVPQVFKRGYDKLVKNKRVLVVEDLTTTGGSVLKVVKKVKEAEGKVVAVMVMVNRDPIEVNSKMMGAPMLSLADYAFPDYPAANCPLCVKGVKINTEVGHGKEFLKQNAGK